MKVLIVALSLPLLLGACNFSASVGGASLDTAKIEDEILAGIEAQTGADIDTVQCPEDVDVEDGGTFECTATDTQGTSAPVRVTQTDDQGNVNWELNPES